MLPYSFTNVRLTRVYGFQTARATLTRLAKFDSPFRCGLTFPAELQNRAAAYSRLIQTVFRHASVFETDHFLKGGDLKELFFSVTDHPSDLPLPRDQKDTPRWNSLPSITESRGETSPCDSQTISLPKSSSNQHTGQSEEISVVPPSTTTSQLPPSTEPASRHTTGIDVRSSTATSTQYRLEDNKSPGPSRQSGFLLSESPRSPTTQSHSSIAGSPTNSPITSSFSNVTVESPAEEPMHLQNPAPRKSAPKAKFKLKKTGPIAQSLIEADLKWHAMKRCQSSEPLTPTKLSAMTGCAQAGSLPVPAEPPANALSGDINQAAAAKPFPNAASSQNKDNAVLSVNSDADVAMDIDTAEGRIQLPKPELQEKQIRPSDLAATGTTTACGGDSKPFKFACIDYGRNIGETVPMRAQLTPEELEKLLIWQNRDQHEQDASASVCLSLVCYEKSDAIQAGYRVESPDEKAITSVLLRMTPSWPANAGLSADIGSSRTFLAPPLQVTDENFVDISRQVSEPHVEVLMDHGEDMREYIFALILHQPTTSQLHELEEERDKTGKWRCRLASLARMTTVDIFG
ncbi:hypothetical protein A7U60_g737 [Sanghuangporus baumii]|uniref:Uncharacterized protein n=1 Tax=Sanghuangporus baumii TaxID=108892 RepID=A0A9Q5NBR3_SANBA|nr:hypothetical protein A7U60_g737 [Sanghuangporus baumii]